MKTVWDFPKRYRIAYGIQGAFYRLGFSLDDVYLGCDPVEGFKRNVLYLQLRTQGKTFSFLAGEVDETKEEAVALWHEFHIAVQTAPEDDLDRCYREAITPNHLMQLIGKLEEKGFIIPAVSKQMAEQAARITKSGEN